MNAKKYFQLYCCAVFLLALFQAAAFAECQMHFGIEEAPNVVIPEMSRFINSFSDNPVQFLNVGFQTNEVEFLNAKYQTSENAPHRISFAKGKSSATFSGTLRRSRSVDDQHYYVIRARAGQGLTLHLKASSGAAAMEVFTPSGEKLFDEMEMDTSDLLPATGDYRIHIFNPGNGNLGNTRYTLTVSIK